MAKQAEGFNTFLTNT